MITANLLQTQQLEACMLAATGGDRATPDQWNWCASHFVSPESLPDTNAYLPRDTTPPISAQVFLDAMRVYQAEATQGANLNGGGGVPDCGGGPVYKRGGKYTCDPTPSGATGNGVLGATNCTTCQKIAANPLLFVVLAVVGFFFVKEARG